MTKRLIFVIGFCPGVQAPGGGVGGYEWRRTRTEAVATLIQLVGDDPDLLNDFVLRAVEVPKEVDVLDKEAVTTWLDTDGFDLWNTEIQDEDEDEDGEQCAECGAAFSVDEHGVATHDGPDYDADADHVPYGGEPIACWTPGCYLAVDAEGTCTIHGRAPK